MNHSTIHHHHAARGLAQTFGIHPAMAALTLTLDWMLFGAETVTLGMSLPISAAVSTALGFIAYRAQIHWYGDDNESAALKAGILALLMAIPTGLPAFLYLPAGFIGFFRRDSPAPEVVNPTAPTTTDTSRSKDVSLPFYG
jgi:hypothetical protein